MKRFKKAQDRREKALKVVYKSERYDVARRKQPSAETYPSKRAVIIWGGLVVAIIAVAFVFVRFRYRLDAGPRASKSR